MVSRDIQRSIPHHRGGGFTLMETLITLAVASIILTAAVPAMQDFVVRNRMSTEVNTFIASLYLARNEAVKRSQDVMMCPTTDNKTCSGGNIWGGVDSNGTPIGWMVFQDVNKNDSVDTATDALMQQNPPPPKRFLITGGTSHLKVEFQSTGQAAGSNNTFTFCDTDNVANTRKIYLSNDGRIRVDKLSTSNCS